MEEGAAKETGDGRTLYVSVEDVTVDLDLKARPFSDMTKTANK